MNGDGDGDVIVGATAYETDGEAFVYDGTPGTTGDETGDTGVPCRTDTGGIGTDTDTGTTGSDTDSDSDTDTGTDGDTGTEAPGAGDTGTTHGGCSCQRVSHGSSSVLGLALVSLGAARRRRR